MKYLFNELIKKIGVLENNLQLSDERIYQLEVNFENNNKIKSSLCLLIKK